MKSQQKTGPTSGRRRQNHTAVSTLAGEQTPQRVIVAGYGPVGRVVADSLRKAGFEIAIIDLNPATIQKQLQLGRPAVAGNAADPAVLELAGITRASALVVTVPDEHDAVLACQHARQLAPDIFIAVRTSFLSKGMLATQAGADHVIVEEVVAAQAMRTAVMQRLMPSHVD